MRTWIAAAFAAGTPLPTVVYEPVTEWITGMGIAASASLNATCGKCRASARRLSQRARGLLEG